MPKKPMKKWNPKYNKTWVRVALQNALSKGQFEAIVDSKRLVKEVLHECDQRAIQSGQEYKK